MKLGCIMWIDRLNDFRFSNGLGMLQSAILNK